MKVLKFSRGSSEITMMVSQSVLVEASAFLLQLVPGGSLSKRAQDNGISNASSSAKIS